MTATKAMQSVVAVTIYVLFHSHIDSESELFYLCIITYLATIMQFEQIHNVIVQFESLSGLVDTFSFESCVVSSFPVLF